MSTVQQPRVVADRYRLVQQLGQGGMGRVWLAHDDLLHRDVAIKEIVPPAGLTPAERQEMRERTLREARAIARLSHPNVVRIFDVLSSDGDPWIIMEYVRGRSLQEVLATDGPVPPARAADIGLGVLAALRAAHRAGVLHRDVKPGNVLLGEDGRVVLTDFGLATVPGDPVVTRTGLVLGSPAYLAPERARDGSAGPEADLWSLGATLYAAVEGQSPYARPSAIATLAALATEPPAPAKQAGPLRPVLNGLLRKDPAERISPAEVERLLLRAAGPRSRPMPGRALFPGVRLRRPPGATTLAGPVAVGPAAAAKPDSAAAKPDSVAGKPEMADSAAAGEAGTRAAGEAASTAPPASKTADTKTETKTDTKTGAETDAKADSDTKTDTRVDTRAEPDNAVTPSTVDTTGDDKTPFVPVVPGPRTPMEPEPAGVVPVEQVPPTGKGGRKWWWAAAAAAAVLVAVLAIAVAVASNGDRERQRGGPGGAPTSAPGGVGAAAPSATPTETKPSPTTGPVSPTPPTDRGGGPALPAGWRFHKDPTGFGVAVPEGWTSYKRNSMVYFRDPNGGRLLGIDQTRQPKPDPVADWTNQEATRRRAGDWREYERVKIEAVEYRGYKTADWEFTYAGNGGRIHVINRGFITSRTQAYGIYWSTPDSTWAENLANFRLITESFQPAR